MYELLETVAAAMCMALSMFVVDDHYSHCRSRKFASTASYSVIVREGLTWFVENVEVFGWKWPICSHPSTTIPQTPFGD